MDSQGNFIATLIDSSSKAVASGAIARLAERDSRVQTWGFQRLVADAMVRLTALSEALAAGRPELFRFEVQWLSSTYAARGVDQDLLRGSLVVLRDELAEALPADVVETARACIDASLDVFEGPTHTTPSFLGDGQPHVEFAREFMLAVLEGRRNDALQRLLDTFGRGVPISELHEHVLSRVQAEMGRMWQAGEVDIAEEHLGSRIVEEALVLLRFHAPREELNGRSVLVASVRGNMHDIGGRMVADRFEMAGWRALFLGADTPSEDIAAAVAHFGADLVAVSVGMGLHVRAAAELVSQIHEAHSGVPVLVGGRVFSAFDDLWQSVGADGSASDAVGAVREAERLLADRVAKST